MSEATKRLRRKDLRQPDEFVTLTGQALDWARAHSQIVVVGGAVLAGVVILAGALSWYQQARAERAARAFYAASELFKRDQWEAAEKSYAELAEGLGSTAYGRLALVYAGRAALRAGRPAEAATYLRDYLRAPVDDLALEQLARINLGGALEATGDHGGAREQLEAAIAIDGPARGEATLDLARIEEASGAKEKALELYQRYLADNPAAVARDLARARIVALGGTPPPAAPAFPGGIPPQLRLQ